MKETITQNNTETEEAFTSKLRQLMKEKRYEEALVWAEENLSPDNVVHQIWIAGMYALLGRYDQACDILVSLEGEPIPEEMEDLLLCTVDTCTEHYENE